MEQLIEFVTSNFIIVLIVIGFIISLFSKSSSKPNNRMPDFGTGNNQQGDGSERRPTVQRPVPGRQPIPAQGYPIPPSEEAAIRMEMERRMANEQAQEADRLRKREADRRAVEERRRANQTLRAAEDSSRPSREARNSGSSITSPGDQIPGTNELMSAVLWAEILGPPRAKRPFR